jgi:hypothetical protein
VTFIFPENFHAKIYPKGKSIVRAINNFTSHNLKTLALSSHLILFLAREYGEI